MKKQNMPYVELWGDGTPKREFLYVDDLADAVIFLMKNYNDNVHVNIGTGEDISIMELAQLIKEEVGYKGEIIFDKKTLYCMLVA
jgi:GDP-L-fucose synthase